MKIALINASPKPAYSGSGNLLDELKKDFPKSAEIRTYEFHRKYISEFTVRELLTMDAWVIFCPLYIDALPSHLLSCLMQIEKARPNKKIRIYGVINCGFYEGRQTDVAFEILENFCNRCGFVFSGGMGIGGGGILSMVPMLAKKKHTKIGVLLKFNFFARKVAKCKPYELVYTSVTMPQKMYKIGAEATWRIANVTNGNKPKELNRRY